MGLTPITLVAAAASAGALAEEHHLALAALAVAAAFALWGRQSTPSTRLAMLAAVALAILSSRLQNSAPLVPGERITEFRGTVVEAQPEPFGTALLLRTDAGLVRATVAGAVPDVGTAIELRGRFGLLDEARNEGESSPRALAQERGIIGELVHARIIAVHGIDDYDPHLWLPRLRAWAGQRLRAQLDEPYASILAGALWGERHALPPDLRAEFQDTGTVHILVTAGLHLGVVGALATGLLSLCRAGRVGSSVGAIAVIWLYAAFSGSHLPSLRAATMLTYALTARALGRKTLSWNALGAAALTIALVWPHSIGTISFALSFSCVAAIVMFAEPIAGALARCGVSPVVGETLALTLATQLGTWPLTAATFLVFAPYAPLANALVVPVVGIAMLLGFLQLATVGMPSLSVLCAHVETSLLAWIVGVVRIVGSLPGAHVMATPPPTWTIALYDISLVALASQIVTKRRAVAAGAFAAALALVLWPPRWHRDELVVTAIDVGQADALLVETPRGHAFLVDAGGRLERGSHVDGISPAQAVGERIVIPYLIRRGIHHLDALLLSHPHGDHAGGAAPVLRLLGADLFVDSGQAYPGFAYNDALRVAKERGLQPVNSNAGDRLTTDDGVVVRFMNPRVPYLQGTRNDINENSLVFMLEFRGKRILFTGDAGADTEARLLATRDDLRADVLKVGHHGSAYSSSPAFIRAVSPKFALVSVGRHNLFGHPARDTLDTLEQGGASIYRTDRDCAVTVRLGQDIVVRPFCQRSPDR